VLLLIAISCVWRRRAGRRALMAALVLLATLCVLSIFFFPVQQGPYAATHGPVTELRTELRSLIPSASLFLALILLTVRWFMRSRQLVSLENRYACWPRSSFLAPASLHDVIRC
jgi:hypothetical protein